MSLTFSRYQIVISVAINQIFVCRFKNALAINANVLVSVVNEMRIETLEKIRPLHIWLKNNLMFSLTGVTGFILCL